MTIFVPLSGLLLVCIGATLAAIVLVAERAALGDGMRRALGSGSALAGASWCAAYLLIAGPACGQESPAAAPPAPAATTPAAAVPSAEAPVTSTEKPAPQAAEKTDEKPENRSPAGEASAEKTAEKPLAKPDSPPTAERPEPNESTPPQVEAEAPAEGAASGGVRSLSVAPSTSVGLAKFDRAKRPAWVESPANHVGAVQTTSIASGAWLSPDESRRAMEETALRATREYLAELVHHPHSELLTSTYDLAFVKSRLLKPERIYEEQIEGELSGSSFQTHALLEFDASFRDEALNRWREIVTRIRLLQVGLGAVAVLAVIGLLFGLLRADTATRGYYTRTLQWVAAAAILGVVAAGVLLAKNIPWL